MGLSSIFLLTFFAIMTLPFTLYLFPLFFCTRSLSFVLLLNFLIVQVFYILILASFFALTQ